jgi:hypothetical protein
MKLFVILAISIGTVASLSGQSPKPAVPVLGAGATSCRDWTGDDTTVYDEATHSWTMTTKTPKDPVKVSWVLGYLSAVGVSGRASEPGGESYLMGWISGACAANPSRTLAAVAADFTAAHPPTNR